MSSAYSYSLCAVEGRCPPGFAGSPYGEYYYSNSITESLVDITARLTALPGVVGVKEWVASADPLCVFVTGLDADGNPVEGYGLSAE